MYVRGGGRVDSKGSLSVGCVLSAKCRGKWSVTELSPNTVFTIIFLCIIVTLLRDAELYKAGYSRFINVHAYIYVRTNSCFPPKTNSWLPVRCERWDYITEPWEGYAGGGVYNFRLRQRNQAGHRERFRPESLGKLGPIVKDVVCIIWLRPLGWPKAPSLKAYNKHTV